MQMVDDDAETFDTPGDDLHDVLGMPPRRAPAVLAAGQIIDDAYRIEGEIGAGGMGRVYRAHDLRLSRDVALKLHGFALRPDDDTLRREATALARLTHPNVVTVYEVGTWNGHPWVAMAYVPGGTVRTWLRAEHRSVRDILALFIAAGRGLEAAHAAGLVHRDFKPDNVLVGDDGRICVADFGLARDANVPEAHVGDIVGSPAAPLSTYTKTGAVRGTPAYMAPEQRDGTRVEASADQYAFAVSLWEALAGGRPFADDGKPIAPPSGRMPRHVEVALRRATSTAPSERWPTMSALLDELARDPARTRFIVAVSVVGVIALVGGGYAIASRRPAAVAAPACGTVDELAATWSDPQRIAMRTAYPGEPGERVVAILDGWTSRWRTERTEVCQSTQPASVIAARDACLDRARASLTASLSVLDDAKLSPFQAVTTASSITPVDECADMSLVGGEAPPTEPSEIVETQAAEALIAQTKAWMVAGQYSRALAMAREAVAYAEPLGRPGLKANALRHLASTLSLTGEKDNVVETYEAAARLAAEAHDDALVAQCYLGALRFTIRDEKFGEVDRLISVAETSLARAGNPPKLVEWLLEERANSAYKREKFAEALPLYQQAIAMLEKRQGAEAQDLAQYLNSLGQVYTSLGKPTEAREALQRSAAIMEKRYGSLHPNLGVILTSIGGLEHRQGDYVAALASYRRALAIKEATLGPAHRSLVPTLINLADVLDLTGAHAEAITVAQRGLVLAEKSLPPAHPKLVMVLNNLATAQMNAGEWTAAKVTIDRTSAILDPLGPDAQNADAQIALARLRGYEKNTRAARTAAEKAVAIATKQSGESSDLARALAMLARTQRADSDSQADATYGKAIEMMRKTAGDGHPSVAVLEAERAGR